MFRVISALALAILFVVPCSAKEPFRTVEGYVKKGADGDTITVISDGTKLRVRLYGIDAPETAKPGEPGQPFGAIAKRTLMYKIMGRQVSAEIVDIDQYRRAVAVLRYGGRDINREMVVEGMAWAYRQYLQGAYASEYIDAEERARARHRGLWRDNNPMPPWEFRQALKGGKRGHGRNRR